MVQMAPPSGPSMPPSRTPVTGDPMQKLLAMKANQGQPPGQVPPIPPQQLQQTGQMPPAMPPQSKPEQSLNQSLKKISNLAAAQLAENAIGEKVQREAEETASIADDVEGYDPMTGRPSGEQEQLQRLAMKNMAMQTLGEASINPTMAMESGGLIGLAGGGGFSGQVPGQGHGMEDNVYMPIVERQEGDRVGTLAVSPDEYVVDAHTMSALGNGSADAGAKVMDQTVKNIRQKAYGSEEQPNEIKGLAALKPLIERV